MNFWKHVNFTNEFHFKFDSISFEHVLRVKKSIYNKENIQEKSIKFNDISLYMTVIVIWHTRSLLLFYNDEKKIVFDIEINKVKIKKSKRVEQKTNNQYEKRLIEWEIKKAKNVDIKIRDNFIIQYYYTKKTLSHYIYIAK